MKTYHNNMSRAARLPGNLAAVSPFRFARRQNDERAVLPFPYLNQTLPNDLVEIATVFDALCIVCYRESCRGQRLAWKGRHPRVYVVDGAATDAAWKPRSHGAANSVTHARCVHRALAERAAAAAASMTQAAALRVDPRRPPVRNMLFLEADYKLWATADAPALARFVRGGRWRVLRLGYSPIGPHRDPNVKHDPLPLFSDTQQDRCCSECRCERPSAVSPVCAVWRKPRQPVTCDIRSVVAFALHHSAFDLLLFWENEVKNASSYAIKWRSLDVFLPYQVPILHYVTPGPIFDGSFEGSHSPHAIWKASSVSRMRRFAALCPVGPAKPQLPAQSLLPAGYSSPAETVGHIDRENHSGYGLNGGFIGVADWNPPVLWSFPGSGNTWMRALLERATGVTTGSVYNDPCLLGSVVGEAVCDRVEAIGATLVNKAHAAMTPYAFLVSKPFGVTLLRPDRAGKNWKGMCVNFLAKCGTWRPTRALIVDRDPLDAIWSDYQRQEAPKSSWLGNVWSPSAVASCGHTSKLPSLDRAAWATAAMRLARTYVDTWASHASFAAHFGDDAVHVVAYEDLKASANSCQVTLLQALRWLDAPVATTAKSSDADRWGAEARAACSSELSVHSMQRTPDNHSRVRNESFTVTAADAWRSKALVCCVLQTIRRNVGEETRLSHAGHITRLAQLLLSRNCSMHRTESCLRLGNASRTTP